MNETTKKLRTYGIAIAVGIGLFAIVWFTRTLPEEPTAYDVVRNLADGFTVAGVVLAGVGGLSWCGTKGTFDMLSYGVSYTVGRFFPMGKKDTLHTHKSFYDYRMEKEERGRHWLKETFFVGLGFFAVALALVLVSQAL